MAYGEIRTVHAILPDGSQIVRYSRSKRWFLEDANGNRIKRYRKVNEAAADLRWGDGEFFAGRPQGAYLEKYYDRFRKGEDIRPVERYTAGGLRRAIKSAKAQYRRDLAAWKRTRQGVSAYAAYPYADLDGSNGRVHRRYQEWWYGRPVEPKLLQKEQR